MTVLCLHVPDVGQNEHCLSGPNVFGENILQREFQCSYRLWRDMLDITDTDQVLWRRDWYDIYTPVKNKITRKMKHLIITWQVFNLQEKIP